MNDNKRYKDCRECHIELNWLLVYRINNDELILRKINEKEFRHAIKNNKIDEWFNKDKTKKLDK
ncbi:MAG: type II toxin-antitoxin system mRNA interferase toxin, RelE/StbE family [Bacilli bacterium]|nr:type II toxin-antitoxin system mRNA interferase toxin, RelE/StbE family [Bacilli bacterium]